MTPADGPAAHDTDAVAKTFLRAPFLHLWPFFALMVTSPSDPGGNGVKTVKHTLRTKIERKG